LDGIIRALSWWNSEADFNFASEYEMLLYSPMVIMRSPIDSPRFCCRLCDGNEVFECGYNDSPYKHIPGIEYHLKTCSGIPTSLETQIWTTRGNSEEAHDNILRF
jgi:hypothetical protein